MLCSCNRNVRRCADGRRNPRNAFSLVELIVVMVILGMLASLVAIKTRGYLAMSRKNAVKAEMATMTQALESFRSTQGRYPSEEEGLQILVDGTDEIPGGLINKVPKDPWKNEYIYTVTDGGFEIICLGADGREGGEEEDEDFTSDALNDDGE